MLKSLHSIERQQLANIEWLLTDVDDTLTWEGQLPDITLKALYDLQEVGIKVVAVTGACAGWCDQIAKVWPVHGAIGENGAFWMSQNKSGFATESKIPLSQMHLEQTELKSALAKILEDYEGIDFAADQPFRFCDVAINLSQDREPVSEQVAKELLTKARALVIDGNTVNASLSSIHLNVWIGEHSKRITSEAYLKAHSPFSDIDLDKVVYIGDSQNDETMFAWLPTTFGVRNIQKVLPQLTHKPSVLLNEDGGFGFAQLAHHIIEAKQNCLTGQLCRSA
ncbi:HAD-IIB family hydrolase [Vibrio breoganii]|uniref:HAD-IIB family hydrolase n=1 Tax=Vibrio breoganii TaxID=553239 RepID=UPI000C8413BA|nr:HAD-IIB family hydrolase [Vibrio breoganii]PMF70233.1 hydrolase [Vibrio breoganii]PMH18433.1 hydrolase [Vibrio breoganii]PMK60672.1 hydrolase [Vibrio breoganii]PMK66515.1 hydrolase [Vibrio breoganii]PML58012.1 hydrolase [Vibrio breoganii]